METIRSSMERAMALQLRLLDCQRIMHYASDFANERWVSGQNCFMDIRPHTGGDINIVNTSTAISVIGRCHNIFDLQKLTPYSGFQFRSICAFYRDSYKIEPGCWESKDTRQWTPYVASYVINALANSGSLASDSTRRECFYEDEVLRGIVNAQIERLFEFLKSWARQELRSSQLGDYDHVYFAYTALEALQAIRPLIVQTTPPLDSKTEQLELDGIVESAIHRFQLEFYKHMTYKLAGLSQHLDVVSLALSLYTLVAHGAHLYDISEDVVDSALDTLFSTQEKTGLWNTSAPLLGVATGRVGCSSIELGNCLLKIPRVAKRFDQFYDGFDRLFTHLQRGFDPSEPKRGWAVDIRRNGDRRQTWYSFYVFEFLNLFATLIEDYAAQLILRGFQYGKDSPQYSWSEIADYENYKARIYESVIKPRAERKENSQAKCSMILFGPPGTGKTSIASALAGELGWGLVQIGPGDFLVHGLEGIFAQGDLIFQRLLLLNRVVVLFDEIDELVRNRDEKDQDTLSRFLTTYMLPWIQRLRTKATIVFIFATNHIEIFDPAIKRLGRFDLVVPIGPPQGPERARLMRCLNVGLSDADLDSLAARIPQQATIGEIAVAVQKAKNGDSPINLEQLCVQLQEGTLLISRQMWDSFQTAARRYCK